MKYLNVIWNIVKQNYIRFLIIFISLLFIESIFKVFAFSSLFDISYIRVILFTTTTSLIVTLISLFFNKIASNIFLLSYIFIMSIYSIAQLGFKSFLGNYMSLNAAGDGAGRVTDEIGDFIEFIKPEYYLILIPFFILLILIIFRRDLYSPFKISIKASLVLLETIIIAHVLSLITLGNNFFQHDNQIVSNKDLYEKPVFQELALRQFGVARYLARDIIYMINPNAGELDDIVITEPNETNMPQKPSYERVIDDSEWEETIEKESDELLSILNKFYISQSITPKNGMTGKFKDKNLIYIMVEAFDMVAINEELTPTLYKLRTEGWYFDNYYTPKYSCTTGESEFIGLTSLVPVSYDCTPNRYQNNQFSTAIFNIFNKGGYYSTSYHNYEDKYYSRTTLHKNMGSVKFYNDDDLDIKKIHGWPSDLNLVREAVPNFIQEDKFLSFIITSSTHFPYDMDSAIRRWHWDKVKGLPYHDKIKTYMTKAIELDLALEYLIDSLNEEGKLEDTVIVLYSDHHPLKMEKSYLNEASSINRYEDFNMNKTPFIIYNSDIEPETFDMTASTFDILPTLLNLFDLEYDPRYYVGKDLFSEEERIVIFTDGSWITDKAMYFSSNGKVKALGEELPSDYVNSINEKVRNYMYVSEQTFKTDYFKYRFDN